MNDPSEAVAAARGSFRDDFEQAVQGLRGALIEVLAAVPDLPSRPFPMARFLGVNKNLAWKVCQVTRASDPADAVRHIPGEGGLGRLLDALAEHGAPEPDRAAVKDALDEFHAMVARHAGDRGSLELMLGGESPDRVDASQVEASRKLSFQGNCATLGVRVRTHFAQNIVGPNADDPSVIDVATVGGLVGFRRLRSGVTWPLMRMQAFSESDSFRLRPLAGGEGPPLLESFCSHPDVGLRAIPVEHGMTYAVPEGPVGQTAESDWVFGLQSRGLGSVYRDDEDGVVEFQFKIATPAELAVCDLLVHRELPFEGPPQVKVFSLMCESPAFPACQNAHYEIPVPERIEDLGRPAVVATGDIRRYREMTAFACERMGWDPSDLRGYRLTLRYPPIPALPVMVYPQLERPTPDPAGS